MLSPAVFVDPPREFGMMPFWLWNDDLDEDEIIRQLRAFHAAGCGGVTIHPRVGLSRRVGYLTPAFFRLVRLAVEEAARLGMKVVLYDEASYPSGSAQGQVVAENPAWAARCLIPLTRDVTGPARGFWRPNPGRALRDRPVCTVCARVTEEGALDAASLALLPIHDHAVVAYDLPAGAWRLVSVWEVCSGGRIRGAFAEEEDGHATAPPAGDLLNPEAVAAFLRLTHDRYAQHVGDHFGTTIVAMFTDEPNPLGRGPQRGPDPQPYTPGFLADVSAAWGEEARRWLPALWQDCGPRTAAFRRTYRRAVHARLERVFYGGQSDWCAAHGLALTGHPGGSNEMAVSRRFHWPGQDIVWRSIEPGKASALEGPDSVAGKSAHSAAVLDGRRFNISEVLGAFGWQLTLDEVKWLLDWHLVRGTNLFIPHAFFYSIRGRRAFESEPDLGLHHAWWPYWGLIAGYVRRLCWLFSDGEEVGEVGILADPDHLPWAAAKALLQAQINFIYVDEAHRQAGPVPVRALVCDPPGAAPRSDLPVIATWTPATLPAQVEAAIGREVRWDGSPDLRVRPYRKDGRDLYLLVNEGEAPVAGTLSLRRAGSVACWDALTGAVRPWPGALVAGRLQTRITLDRRASLVLTVDPAGAPDASAASPPAPGEVILDIPGPWQAATLGGEPADVPCPGDWARCRGWELFSGTLVFRTTFTLADAVGAAFLDLGGVGDIAEVSLDGQPAGVCAWAPYRLTVDGLRAGEHTLEVRVTNSMANAFDGRQLPSGVLGPVRLRACTAG